MTSEARTSEARTSEARTASDALLHESNRLAHEVARAALKQRHAAQVVRGVPAKAPWKKEASHRLAKATGELNRALERYEAADRRAQRSSTQRSSKEATG